MNSSNQSGNLQNQVLGNLQDAASPLDFIKNNLNPNGNHPANNPSPQPTPQVTVNNQPVSDPMQVVDAIANSVGSAELPQLSETFTNPDLHLTNLGSEPEAQEEEIKPDEQVSDNPLIEEMKNQTKTKEDSFKDLRKTIHSKDEEITTLSSQLTELQTKLAKYEQGEAVPETVQARLDRVAELEKYEKLHALKLSPEFHERFVKPRESLQAKIIQMAEEYNVPTEVVNQALDIKDKRQANQYLRQYFDEVGALEVREVIENIRNLDEQAALAEREPGEAFSKIQTEIQAERVQKDKEKLQQFTEISKNGWVGALTEVREEGLYPELVIKEGNENHNKIARPVVENAAKEFGKFVNLLVHLGVKELPVEAAKILAKRFQLSEAALVISKSRDHFYNEAQTLISNSQKKAVYARPPIGGAMPSAGGSSSSASTPSYSSPQEKIKSEADALINGIMNR